MKKVGFFGGSFDPIHFGHLNLALSILEAHHLDHVLFSPAFYSPEKKETLPKASSVHRKKMVELAIEPIAAFSLFEFELERQGPSFTIEAIRFLKEKKPECHFFLLLGEDTLQSLEKWKEIETLLTLAPPLIGSRPRHLPASLPNSLEEKVKAGQTKIPKMQISSTALKERLAQKKYCGHLIPAQVLDYIYAHGLYS